MKDLRSGQRVEVVARWSSFRGYTGTLRPPDWDKRHGTQAHPYPVELDDGRVVNFAAREIEEVK